MAAPSKSCIRVRLHFDFPPPSVAGCRMCWMLVDTSSCRFITDLESLVRDKFEYSPGSILSLFLDDCYLPHTESVALVRDNDCVRVRLDTVPQVNGHSDSPAQVTRKRRRDVEADVPGEAAEDVEWKTKKRKKSVKEKSVEDKIVSEDDESKNSVVKEARKKKKKLSKENVKTVAAKSPTTPTPKKKKKKQQSSDASKTNKAQPGNTNSSISSSSSGEDVAPKKAAPKAQTVPKKLNSKPSISSPTSSKTNLSSVKQAPSKKQKENNDKSKMHKTKPVNSSSSSSGSTCSSSSSEEDVAPKKAASKPQKFPTVPEKLLKSKPAVPSPTSSKTIPSIQKRAKPIKDKTESKTHSEPKSQEASNLDQPMSEEEEIEFVIHAPRQPADLNINGHSFGRGRGRGTGPQRSVGGEFGRARERPGNSNGYQEPSYHTDILSNTSVVVQNAAKIPKPDYSVMPLLAAPPPVGQKLAFKLLELTENYSPEVSDYKEGKIISFDYTSQQIELELLNTTEAVALEPGRFDLVYSNPDGSERVEYAVSRESKITERWDSLLEPRLII